jgi:hypothetical protein
MTANRGHDCCRDIGHARLPMYTKVAATTTRVKRVTPPFSRQTPASAFASAPSSSASTSFSCSSYYYFASVPASVSAHSLFFFFFLSFFFLFIIIIIIIILLLCLSWCHTQRPFMMALLPSCALSPPCTHSYRYHSISASKNIKSSAP